jgi:predicted nucleic acid-binding protein
MPEQTVVRILWDFGVVCLNAPSIGGLADYLVTGDKKDLLAIKKYDGTSIISVTNFLKQTSF